MAALSKAKKKKKVTLNLKKKNHASGFLFGCILKDNTKSDISRGETSKSYTPKEYNLIPNGDSFTCKSKSIVLREVLFFPFYVLFILVWNFHVYGYNHF